MAMDLSALQLKIAQQNLEDLEDVHLHEKRVLVDEVKRNRAVIDEKDEVIRGLWAQLDAARLREKRLEQGQPASPSTKEKASSPRPTGKPTAAVQLPSSKFEALLDTTHHPVLEVLQNAEQALADEVRRPTTLATMLWGFCHRSAV